MKLKTIFFLLTIKKMWSLPSWLFQSTQSCDDIEVVNDRSSRYFSPEARIRILLV